MSYLQVNSKFKLHLLALSVSLSFMTPVWAMEAIGDEDLASSTGEGIAFLPENFSVLLQGANNNNPTAADLNDRTKDTGYIRLIPVGPLTSTAQNSGAGKADIYLYGLAISQSNQDMDIPRTSADWNNRFGRTINSWGSLNNPWLFKVQTETGVPNFSAISPTDTGAGDVTYLGLEAPLYNANVNGYTYDASGNLTGGSNSGINGLSAAEKSAYNLKLGLWADAFVRNPNVAENLTATGTQFDVGGINRANRLRLQVVWDGFSLNGTNVKLFQTLDRATNTGGMSTFYNNTLGIAGLLRFNTGDSSAVSSRGTTTGVSSVKGTETTQVLFPTASSATPNPNSGCGASLTNFANARCFTQERVLQRTDTTSTQWVAPNFKSVLRLSTRESGTGQGLLNTPAINGGAAPNFDANEGIFIYNANINLVLGSLYQPLVVGVASDNKNIALEIARIPNKESIYKKIYTAYPDMLGTVSAANATEYKGSTCNVYKCGDNITLSDGKTYQGSTATHSSITIGSTNYNSTTNALSAYTGIGAVGISFGPTVSGTGTYSESVQQVQTLKRRWETYLECQPGFLGLGCGSGDNRTNTWQAWGDYPTNGTGWYNVERSTIAIPQVLSTNGVAGMPANAIQKQSAPSNNLGSAVIDGLLIQHLKITTKGL